MKRLTLRILLVTALMIWAGGRMQAQDPSATGGASQAWNDTGHSAAARAPGLLNASLVTASSDKAPKETMFSPTELEVANEAYPERVREPGGEVRFKVKLHNKGKTALAIQSLEDKLDGVLLPLPEGSAPPPILAAGAQWQVVFKAQVTGKAGETRRNVAVVTATDASGKPLQVEARAQVAIIPAGDSGDDDAIVKGAVIGDRVWLDQNRDGLQSNNEPSLQGVTLRLIACRNHQVLKEIVSDAAGMYQFEGDFPALVYLAVVRPEGYGFTMRKAGDDPKLDSDIDPATGRSKVIDLRTTTVGGQPVLNSADWDAGLVTIADRPHGVLGAGYWKRHLEAWGLDVLIIGGRSYTKFEAARLMANGSDKTHALFRSLVAVLLNQAAGAPTAAIDKTIAAAQDWLAAHAPGSGVRPNSDVWKNSGQPLNQILENYNEGKLGARKADEAETPGAVSAGLVARGPGQKPEWLQLRVHADKGRTVILQKSSNLIDWVDVETLDNPFGVSESLRAEIASDPNGFYRVVFPEGPAQIQDGTPASAGPARQVGSNEQVELPPLLYKGDLEISGRGNVIKGTVAGQTGTVIAGDLIIKGNDNLVSDLTVLGKIVIQGKDNELLRVDYEGEVQVSGKDNNLF